MATSFRQARRTRSEFITFVATPSAASLSLRHLPLSVSRLSLSRIVAIQRSAIRRIRSALEIVPGDRWASIGTHHRLVGHPLPERTFSEIFRAHAAGGMCPTLLDPHGQASDGSTANWHKPALPGSATQFSRSAIARTSSGEHRLTRRCPEQWRMSPTPPVRSRTGSQGITSRNDP